MIEVLIVLAIIGIVTTFAIINFQRSRRRFVVAGSAATLSSYLEKARIDAIRGHGTSNIVFNSETSYTINTDFDGSGTISARTITLPAGTRLRYTLPPASASLNPSNVPVTVAYDWRGRTTNVILVTVQDSTSGSGIQSSTVAIGSAGDISTDTTVTGPVANPTPRNTTVTTTSEIKSMTF